jgi:hypothetical protein
MMSLISRAAWLLKAKRGEILQLKQQLNACRMNLTRAEMTIDDLQCRLAQSLEERAALSPSLSPSDRILADIVQNNRREPSGRRYSRETLVGGRRVHEISPHARKLVLNVLPLQCAPLLCSKFPEIGLLSEVLLDRPRMGELLELWREPVRCSITWDPSDSRAVFAVDAVAFRPVVTLKDTGEVEGLEWRVQITKHGNQ